MTPRRRRACRALSATLLGLALTLPATASLAGTGATAATDPPPGPVEIDVTIPGSTTVEVQDAELRWAINAETGSGAFFGGCNFLSAGAVGDTGGGKVWTQADGFYASAAGDVSIERPTTDGERVRSTFATRCLDREGDPVSTADERTTEAEVVIEGGRGTVDRETGTATIRWTGSFTVVYYGGLTYWWASDPVLTIDEDGTGTLTATASGYGTSMEDTSRWDRLPATQVVLADLDDVSLDDPAGFAVVPEYLGVAVSGAGIDQAPRSSANAASWGSFPQSFVRFQVGTGQAAYWYSTNGVRDRFKPPAPLLISYDASDPVDRPETPPLADGASTGGSTSGRGSSGGAPEAGPPTAQAPAAGPSTGGAAPPAAEPEAVVLPTGPVDTTLPESGLIPAVLAAAGGLSDPVLWSAAGTLALASLLVLGLGQGWLVLPWAR